MAPSLVTVTSYVRGVRREDRARSEERTYTNIVHHHLIETAGAEGALDDICDGLGSGNCQAVVSACVP